MKRALLYGGLFCLISLAAKADFSPGGAMALAPGTTVNLGAGSNLIGTVGQNGQWTVSLASGSTIGLAAGSANIGSVNIAGTPSFTLSGTPAVTLSGSPTVTLSGTSTVSLASGASVSVSNLPATQPISGTVATANPGTLTDYSTTLGTSPVKVLAANPNRRAVAMQINTVGGQVACSFTSTTPAILTAGSNTYSGVLNGFSYGFNGGFVPNQDLYCVAAAANTSITLQGG